MRLHGKQQRGQVLYYYLNVSILTTKSGRFCTWLPFVRHTCVYNNKQRSREGVVGGGLKSDRHTRHTIFSFPLPTTWFLSSLDYMLFFSRKKIIAAYYSLHSNIYKFIIIYSSNIIIHIFFHLHNNIIFCTISVTWNVTYYYYYFYRWFYNT